MNRITYGWKYGGAPNPRWITRTGVSKYGRAPGKHRPASAGNQAHGFVIGPNISRWFSDTGFTHYTAIEQRELGWMMTIVIPDDIEYRLFCMAFPELAS